MKRFGRSFTQFEHDMDVDINTKFYDISEKIMNEKLDCALEELDEIDFATLRQRSSIHPDRTRGMMEATLDKTDALKNYKNIIELRQKYEALLQLKYFLKDLTTRDAFNMETYLKKKI